MSDRALSAKNKGNVHFKAGRLQEAAKCYREATALDPDSAIYPSNLSAALYELGQYASCLQSILDSWRRLDLAIDNGIAKKLSSRLAKSLVLGLQDGSIPPALVHEHYDMIQGIRAVSENDPSWTVYRDLDENIQRGQYDNAKNDAKKRFAQLPLFHGTPDPELTYFTFGTDDMISLADGWGPQQPDPLPLKDYTNDQLGNLSFLIAGVGDARHAFATLIGLHSILTPNPTANAEQSRANQILHDFGLTLEQKAAVQVHMTLLDIHPATIARDIIFFMLFDQLVSLDTQITDAKRRKERGKERAPTDEAEKSGTVEEIYLEKLEILSTIFYLYSGYMLPPYCYDRWVSAVKTLHTILSNPFFPSPSPPSLPSYLSLPLSSYPLLIPYLDHWLKPPIPTAKFTRLMKHIGGFERTKQLQGLHASGALGPKYSGMPDPTTMHRNEAERKVDSLLSGHGSGSGIRASAASGSGSRIHQDKHAKNERTKDKELDERDLRAVLTKLLGYAEEEVEKMPFTKLRQKVKDARDDLVELLVAMKMERGVMYGVSGSMLREGEWVGAGASVPTLSGMGVGVEDHTSTPGVSVHIPPRELREKYHGKQFDLWLERIAKEDCELTASATATEPKPKGAPSKKKTSSSASKSPGTSSSPSSSKWYSPKHDWDKVRLGQAARVIRQAWKANMSLDDGGHGALDQELNLDLFQNIHYFADFDEIYGLGSGQGDGFLEGDEGYERKRESPAWAYGAAFFMGVVDAIRYLARGEGEGEIGAGRLKIEFVADGLHEHLAKIRAGADEARPESFPNKWTRVWLGSVPDYTNGTLNTMTYVVPALQDDVPSSSVASNCLFNSPVWADDVEFCYNYTMLLPSDLKRYLGLHTINPNAVQDVLNLNSHQSLPRPLHTLATKPELFAWLTKLFLSHIHPGFSQPRPRLVRIPNGLPAFLGLLVRLRDIGYPGHWLSEWLQTVLDGDASTDTLVYKDVLPRPLRGKGPHGNKVAEHKVRLDPWLLELEWILATGKESLPFVVRLPRPVFESGKEAQSFKDVGTFEAKGLEPTIEYGMFYNHDPGYLGEQGFLLKIGKIVDNVEVPEGKTPVPKGAFYVYTAPERVDLGKVPPGMKRAVGGGLQSMMAGLMRGAMGGGNNEDDGPGRGEVRWRMGKASAKKMIREKWYMVVFRMDLWMPLAHPCPANRWIFQND